ncbi:MAG: long-chain fatty acid--CoA ligase [Bacteroidales bacterium]
MANQEINRIFDLLHKFDDSGPYFNKPDVFAGKVKGNWVIYSSRDYIQAVDALSTALLKMGVKKGENIATILKNCPEWNLLDMAIMQIGAVHVPVYPTISADNFKYIFLDASVKFVFVSNKDIYNKANSVIASTPSVQEIFSVENVNGCRTVNQLIEENKEDLLIEEIRACREKINPDELATIIYTSGTTGNPKGVMLSHRNFISNFITLADEILPKNFVFRAMSFLPLCHVYERVLNYMYQYLGISIYYCENIEALANNLKEAQPDIFCAVPRVIEKFFDKIISKGRGLSPLKKNIFFWAVNLGYRYQLYGRNTIFFKMQHAIADKLVFSKWREALGGNIKIIVSGGAALQSRLSHVFWAAGIQMMEGYGLTETSPVIAVGRFVKDGVRIGTVGPVLPGVTVKIAEDGEILCKGPNVMMGYYQLPEVTREVIDEEGWFHTGDIGYLVDNKYIKITDRKKEIFKTSGGKFIAPQPLENKLKESPFIENVIVVGENQAYPAALIVPNFEHIRNWSAIKGHPLTTNSEIAKNQDVYKRIQQDVNEINKTQDKTEQIKKIFLLDHDWTVDSDELSPTLKLKRKVLQMKYKDIIEELYLK